MVILIAALIFISAVLLVLELVPMVQSRFFSWRKQKEEKVMVQLDNLFYDKNPTQIVRLYFILPPVLAGVGFFLFDSWILSVAGFFLGLAIPNMIIKLRNTQRRIKFNNQILDAIMLLSSSLKGGLSLLQAFEVLVEEMPAPISQEFGLLVRENKMGVTLEEGLIRMDKRMHMDELTLVINSVLVARETGGDLTKVFSRLSTTIRDNRKLKENIRTLTMQGRMQGVIMSILPFLFVWWVLTFDKHHFDIMLQNDTGRMLLLIAIALQLVGMFLIRKFSKINI
ncbi:MAG: type II secretion system F family protein [Candidatus Omnitrophica bacterium]|nr:type II secretion system F family protein [Candidatus Omnitrophota bacterium]